MHSQRNILSRAQREQFRTDRVVALEQHPGFVRNIAASPARIGTTRFTDSFDVLTSLVATLIREATMCEFALYLGERTPGILSAPAVVEALTEFVAKGDTKARFIIGTKAYRLSETDHMVYGTGVPELNDPREYSWRPLMGKEIPPPASVRFMVTDTHGFLFNDFGNEPRDFTSSYGFRSPEMGEDLWRRFDARFEQFNF